MGALVWIILGIVGGIIACRLRNQKEVTDYVINIIVGTAGAFAGGFSGNLVMQQPVFSLGFTSFLVSILGALVFLVVVGAMRRR